MSRFKNAQEIHAENGTRDMRLENMSIEELFTAHMSEAHPEKQMPEPRSEAEKQECFTYDDMRHAFARGWHASKHVRDEGMRAAMQSSASSSCAATVPEGCTPTDAKVLREGNFQLATENQRLREALRFYANRQHWTCEGAARLEWDTVSGEPQNWHWRENATDDAEGIEDGEIARSALRGENVDWDGDSPPVIEGEPEWHIEQAAKASAVPESGATDSDLEQYVDAVAEVRTQSAPAAPSTPQPGAPISSIKSRWETGDLLDADAASLAIEEAERLQRELAEVRHDLERAVANHAADLSASSASAARKGVFVPQDVWDWLMGEGPDFDPTPEQVKGPFGAGRYWWRSELRRRVDSALSSIAATVPAGWKFQSADFSMPNSGRVMFMRDAAGQKWWFSLTEEEQDRIPLYVWGEGATFEAAMEDARKNALAAPVSATEASKP